MIDTNKLRENIVTRAGVLMLLDEIDRLTAELKSWDGIINADKARLIEAAERVGMNFGCDTPEHMADEIIELRAELDRYRWLPYPANKPSKRGTWLATLSDGECHADDLIFPVFYVAEKDKWNLEDEGLSHLIVTAYRPMPEAYSTDGDRKPVVCKTCGGSGGVEVGDSEGSHIDPCPDCEASND